MADDDIGAFLPVDSRDVCCTVEVLLDGDSRILLYSTALTVGEVLTFLMGTLTRSEAARPKIIDITGTKVEIGLGKLMSFHGQNVTLAGREYRCDSADGFIYRIDYAPETNVMGFDHVVMLVSMFAHARRELCSPSLLQRWQE